MLYSSLADIWLFLGNLQQHLPNVRIRFDSCQSTADDMSRISQVLIRLRASHGQLATSHQCRNCRRLIELNWSRTRQLLMNRTHLGRWMPMFGISGGVGMSSPPDRLMSHTAIVRKLWQHICTVMKVSMLLTHNHPRRCFTDPHQMWKITLFLVYRE